MKSLSYKTVSANKATVNKDWLLVDLSEETLGRAASKIATLIRGKHKTNFTPHVDCGDNIVVINASKVQLNGNKWEEKKYIRHTGYPGGQREITAFDLLKKDSTRLIRNAVKGMLPKNKLGNALLKNLHIYANDIHKQNAQNPKKINLKDVK